MQLLFSFADPWCRRWLGMTAIRTYAMVVGGFFVGAGIELFMINVWIKDTNFYEVVKKKEAEKRAAVPDTTEKPFGEILKEQWEAKKKELEQSKN